MNISLFGYAKTSKALAELLAHNFKPCFIYDDSFTQIQKDEFGNILAPVNEFNPLKSELEIPSPGFPPNHKLIQEANNLQSEYDFFYDAMPKSAWISGTNGKTTTTQMTIQLLNDIKAQMGGNIGVPLAKLDCKAKFWVLETSSFTLHYTKKAKPEIYALLPITKDHLSWHGSFKAYEEAKLSILKRLNESDVAIIPENYAKISSKATIISYKDEKDLANKFDIDIHKVHFKEPFLLDALLALSIEKILLDRTSYKLINSFVIEENKLEELRDSKNRLWVNDTKATNLDASLAALKRYKNKGIHLIIGGDDKGVDLSELFSFMQGLNIKLYCIGSSTQKMIDYAREFKLEAKACEHLQKAVFDISKALKADEVGLLSPACASLDQFDSYAQRGELFKELVKAL